MVRTTRADFSFSGDRHRSGAFSGMGKREVVFSLGGGRSKLRGNPLTYASDLGEMKRHSPRDRTQKSKISGGKPLLIANSAFETETTGDGRKDFTNRV